MNYINGISRTYFEEKDFKKCLEYAEKAIFAGQEYSVLTSKLQMARAYFVASNAAKQLQQVCLGKSTYFYTPFSFRFREF